MNDTILLLLLSLSTISFILLLIKSIMRKEIAVFGAALSRIYLSLAIITYLIARSHFGFLSPIYIHIGIMFVIIGDIFSSSLRLITELQRLKVYKYVGDSMNRKFHAAVDSSLVPFFTVDKQTGKIEYANQQLANILGYTKEELLGKELFRLLDPSCTTAMHEIETSGKITCFIKTAEGVKKALFLGTKTVNGHETITGSIYLQ